MPSPQLIPDAALAGEFGQIHGNISSIFTSALPASHGHYFRKLSDDQPAHNC